MKRKLFLLVLLLPVSIYAIRSTELYERDKEHIRGNISHNEDPNMWRVNGNTDGYENIHSANLRQRYLDNENKNSKSNVLNDNLNVWYDDTSDQDLKPWFKSKKSKRSIGIRFNF